MRQNISSHNLQHNAHTVAAIYHMAGSNYYKGQYEFQCLHGMGEPLYEEVVGPQVTPINSTVHAESMRLWAHMKPSLHT